MKRFFTFIAATLFASCLFFYTAPLYAAEEKSKPIQFTAQVTIPGTELFVKGKTTEITADTLPTLIHDAYLFIVGIAGMASVIVMMAGGYLWLFAGGNTGRVGQAKEYIASATFGLLLSVGSYMILLLINPALVNLSNFKLTPVPKLTVLGILECGKQLTMMEQPSTGGLGFNMTSSKPYFNDQLIAALTKAAADADAQTPKYKLIVTSGFREPLDQKGLYDDAVRKYGKESAGQYACDGDGAGNFCSCPHVTGDAVDVCMILKGGAMTTGTGCTSTVAKEYNGVDPWKDRQVILQQIMQKAGFSRYCKEWWHFELPQRSEACAPGVYK